MSLLLLVSGGFLTRLLNLLLRLVLKKKKKKQTVRIAAFFLSYRPGAGITDLKWTQKMVPGACLSPTAYSSGTNCSLT